MPKYGGYIQGQYYFTNQWYVSVLYGFDKAYGVGQDRNGALNVLDPANIQGYTYASITDQNLFNEEIQGTLFFKPSGNLKFGLGYSFMHSNYFQITTNGSKNSRDGYNHTVQFAGWFFF